VDRTNRVKQNAILIVGQKYSLKDIKKLSVYMKEYTIAIALKALPSRFLMGEKKRRTLFKDRRVA
jgi:hypothetical protein